MLEEEHVKLDDAGRKGVARVEELGKTNLQD
jgi:hypothetical protein